MDRLELYRKILATIPEIELKGDANAYTAVNGNMFTLLRPDSPMALRLPAEEREEFLKKHKTKLYEAYGAVMREYVAVPDALLKNTKAMSKYVAASYAYAESLKHKPTTKKKKH